MPAQVRTRAGKIPRPDESLDILRDWLPQGKRAAVCFTIDDIHPGKSSDLYEAGGDLDAGALGQVHWLLKRHPQLWVTLFTTADWRETSPVPTLKMLAKNPYLRDKLYLTELHPVGTMRLGRHPEFVAYLKSLPRTELAFHGLHHIHKGPKVLVEFQNDLSLEECRAIVGEMIAVFEEAGLPYARGMNPPGWEFPPHLATAMIEAGLVFVSSARDIRTPVSPDAVTAMSGLTGRSLIFPELICDGKLVHFTANFQATSRIERAFEIIDQGGLLNIKAHIIKNACGYIMLDGVDELYCNYLDLLFSELERRYGDALWWTSVGAIAERMMSHDGRAAQPTGS